MLALVGSTRGVAEAIVQEADFILNGEGSVVVRKPCPLNFGTYRSMDVLVIEFANLVKWAKKNFPELPANLEYVPNIFPHLIGDLKGLAFAIRPAMADTHDGVREAYEQQVGYINYTSVL